MKLDDVKAIFGDMFDYGFDFPPEAEALSKLHQLWLDHLGDLDVGQVRVALREYMSGPNARKWPMPAELRQAHAALSRRFNESGGQGDGPNGCPSCGWRGTRSTLIFGQTMKGEIERVTGVVYCTCALADFLRANHLRMERPVTMLSVEDFRARLQRSRWVEPGETDAASVPLKGILWADVADERQHGGRFDVPDWLRRAMGQSSDERAAAQVERERRIERGEERRRPPRRPDDEGAERRVLAFRGPLRPDQGWDGRAERFGGGA